MVPVAPVGPVAPVNPVGPVGPVAPVGPVGPVGPIGPPLGPVGPVGPVTLTICSKRLISIQQLLFITLLLSYIIYEIKLISNTITLTKCKFISTYFMTYDIIMKRERYDE